MVAIKGAYGARPPLVRSESKRARGLHILGVDPLKGRLFDRLSRKVGVRFSDTLPGAWYEQLTAERRTSRSTLGRPHPVFERYSGRRESDLHGETKPVPAMSSVIRSAWLGR